MSSILFHLLVFAHAWKKGKQANGTYIAKHNFCLQVGFFFSSVMCIVCFHFWICSFTFVPVLKKSGSNNTHKRIFGHSPIKSSPSSYPSKHMSAAIYLQGKTKWCLIKECDFIVPLNQILNFVFTPWEIYFARQKASPIISDNFYHGLTVTLLNLQIIIFSFFCDIISPMLIACLLFSVCSSYFRIKIVYFTVEVISMN